MAHRPAQSNGAFTFSDEIKANFARTAFVVGKFPQLTQTFIYRELAALRRFGLRFTLVALNPTDFPDDALEPEIRELRRECIYLQIRSPRFYAVAGWRIAREPRFVSTLAWMSKFRHRDLFRRARAMGAVAAAAYLAPELRARGIRHLHSHFADFQTETAMTLAKMLGISYSCSWHAADVFKDRNILPDKLRLAERVLCCTRFNLEHLRAIAPDHAHRLTLAYHGVNVPESAAQTSPSASNRFLAVGRLIPKKGFTYLIDAVAQAVTDGADVHLDIVGEGALRSALKRRIASLGLGGRVLLHGALPNAVVMARMANSRALIVPSVKAASGDLDGIPNVILEAMMQSRPVLASSLPSICEVVRDGDNGLLSAPGNVSELASQLKRLIEDDALVDRLGSTARAVVLQKFSADANAKELAYAVSAAQERASTCVA